MSAAAILNDEHGESRCRHRSGLYSAMTLPVFKSEIRKQPSRSPKAPLKSMSAVAFADARSITAIRHLTRYRAGVCPRDFLKTEMNALGLLYPDSSAAVVTFSPDASS